jgi:hypothetical protein
MSIFRTASACALIALAPCLAFGLEAKDTGHAQTSISAKNTILQAWKVTVDPEVDSTDSSQYIPVDGELDTHFDTSQFTLNTDPSTGTFGVGSSVAGENPYQVLGFEVQTVDGGLYNVQANTATGGSTVTQDTSSGLDPSDGPVGGGLTGNIYDIHFQLIPDERAEAQPANIDQNFYSLFLTAIGNDPPGLDSTFLTPEDYVTLTPIDPGSGLENQTIPFSEIETASTPEVSSAGFLAVGALVLLARRKVYGTRASAKGT